MKNRIILLLFALASCSKGMDTDLPRQADLQDVSHDQIVLGEKLEDPYSLDNVKSALEILYPTKAGSVALTPTDIYVRFLPEDEDQYRWIEEHCDRFTDHPVDYRIVKEGDYYHDPSIEENHITWQYAVVPSDFSFPGDIRYEVLDRCFIPESQSATRASDDGIDWQEVERKAYEITGNAALMPTKSGSSPRPSGRITVVDDCGLNETEIGVAGVKVVCNTFVKFSSTYTDVDGYYEIPKTFSSNPRYSLVFKNRKGFAIGFNLVLVPASVSTLGKQSAEGVDLKVDRTSDRKLFSRCVMNNAGWDYYEWCEENGVTAPPSGLRLWTIYQMSSSATVMMKHGTLVDEPLVASFLGVYQPLVKLFLPDIVMGLKGHEDYASIHSATIHEMAHATHFARTGKSWWLNLAKYMLTSYVSTSGNLYGTGSESGAGYCEVAEMWACFVQNLLYSGRYVNKLPSFGYDEWFRPQILMYLSDRNFTPAQMSSALCDSTKTAEAYETELIDENPEDRTLIEQAFERYR